MGKFRSARELINDFRAALFRLTPKSDSDRITVFLSAAEIRTLKECYIPYPRKRAVANGYEWAVALNAKDWHEFYNAVYHTAQVLIGKAAKENVSQLSGNALQLGGLAARLLAQHNEIDLLALDDIPVITDNPHVNPTP